MALSSRDYLTWYNNEITRYRDMEWRITGYSMSISYFTALFAIQPVTSFLIASRWLPILFILLVQLGLLLSEIHTHERLNEYRSKREALLDNKAKIDHRKVTGNVFGANVRDKFFLLGFTFVPTIIAWVSILTIYNTIH